MNAADFDRALPALPELARRLGLELAPRPRTASRVMVACPWHHERTPSCSIVRRDGRVLAHCHGCHEGGDLLDLVAAVHGLDVRRSFPRVLEVTAQLLGVDLPEQQPRRSRRQRPDPAVLSADALERLAEGVLSGRETSPRAERDLWGACLLRLRRDRGATVGGVLCEALRDLAALDARTAHRDPLEAAVDALEASGELRQREVELDQLGAQVHERDLFRLEVSLALAGLEAA